MLWSSWSLFSVPAPGNGPSAVADAAAFGLTAKGSFCSYASSSLSLIIFAPLGGDMSFSPAFFVEVLLKD